MRKLRIYLETKLPDVSGELLKFLAPISNSTANITEIIHMRERKHGNRIPVGVYLEVDERGVLPPLIDQLNKLGYSIVQNRDLTALKMCTFIIIGHVFRTGITDLIDQIFNVKGVTVRGVNAKIISEGDASTVGLTIGSYDEKGIDQASTILERICAERDLQLITPLVIK